MIINTMTDLIGNTPLLKLEPTVTGLKNIDVYAKLEMMNPFGSVKDRTAWGMVKDDLAKIKTANMTIYENSSGNTAKSLQAIAGIHGIKFRLVSALAKVEEQKQVLQILGSEIEEIANASDCFDPTDNNDPQFLIERTAKSKPGEVYFPSQFTNEKNPAYHEETTAQEIINDLGSADYFFGGLGTTGSSLGITRKLRQINPELKSFAATAKSNQFIPGIRSHSQMWESGLFKADQYNAIIEIGEQDAIQAMLTLNRRSGVLCGISSGANFACALQTLRIEDQHLTERKTAVFIVCDRMEWYISYLKERQPEIFGESASDMGLAGFEESETNSVEEISADHFEEFQRRQPNLIIVDIRTAQSFAMMNIPGSINMPVPILRSLIDNHNPFPAGSAVMLVCAVGEQSRFYAAYLKTLGCNACNLSGGIMMWADLSCMAT